MSKKTYISGLAALGLLFGASFAQACTLGAWLGGADTTGDQVAGGPNEATKIARYSGSCSMQTTNGFVQDYSPADESRMITRFYFLPEGDGSAVIYQAFSNEPAADGSTNGTPVYNVSYDSTSGQITVADQIGSASVSAPVVAGNWNSVEIDWQSGASIDVWVNADSTSAGATASTSTGVGAGTISSARLGADSVTGTPTFLFDDYEARRTTAIGRLLRGDANDDQGVNSGDLVSIVNEFLGISISIGQPDCNEDGAVNSGDLVCVVNIFLGL